MPNFAENKFFIMDTSSVQPPLSNVQSEMLKLFSTEIPEKELVEIKDMIARYLPDKARDKADAAWITKIIQMKNFGKLWIKNDVSL